MLGPTLTLSLTRRAAAERRVPRRGDQCLGRMPTDAGRVALTLALALALALTLALALALTLALTLALALTLTLTSSSMHRSRWAASRGEVSLG